MSTITWAELKRLYLDDHLSKGLKRPEIRINALNKIEKLIKGNFPEIIENPVLLVSFDKKEFLEKLDECKGSPLNSAEKSVTTGLIKFMMGKDNDLNSETIQENDGTEAPAGENPEMQLNWNILGNRISGNKEKYEDYRKIADAVNDVLESKGFQAGNYLISEHLNWLPTTPSKEHFQLNWENLCEVYKYINGEGLELDKVLQKYTYQLVIGKQEADVFFYEPFQMIFEFDEDQHFNQFRGMTLKSDFYRDYPGFEFGQYARLSKKLVKPGSDRSGFNFLKTPDPLFPPIPRSKLQDNRHRQRAFRDFLKDVIAKEKGIKPTVRIPAEVIMNKRNNLNERDVKKIKDYLQKLPLFNDFDNY